MGVDCGLPAIMFSPVTISAFLCLSLTLLVSARPLVEDENETVGRSWTNTTTPSSHYDEDPPNYPHHLILQLLQNFTPVPGLFDRVENQPEDFENMDLVSVVHHNNLDLDLEFLK